MFRARMFGFVTLLIVATSAVHGQVCDDPAGECSDIPCPCANTCNDANDCADGMDCLPFGTPGVECASSICFCDGGLPWVKSDDCAPQCVAQVPAVSAWGLVAMLLLLLTTSTAILLWRRRSEA